MTETHNATPVEYYTQASLQRQLPADGAAAVVAAASISSIITVTDRSVVENVSTRSPLLKIMAKNFAGIFTRPRSFFSTRALYIVCTMYTLTYFTANSSETLIDNFTDTNRALTGTCVSSAVFVVNTPLGVWKDVRFAQVFGARPETVQGTGSKVVASCVKAPRKMPMSVTSVFLARDFITVFGSFFLAPYVSKAVPDSLVQSAHAKASVAQLIVPGLTQLPSTPMHLLALDLYSRPKSDGVLDRLNATRRNYFSITLMRAARLVPAFGVGIILNSDLRRAWRGTPPKYQQGDTEDIKSR
ncbi:uncharacterized protein JN550_010981 [Neoarthrinium moseri]|uniref:uncharacterized protein n=1 Tax=Neoarthrinium moseri TaxID=1658444 RepID=UPI001FDC8D91|nr:uncharacterized protein JN550_010981 [Neoarthrinium moseri]KAI1861302.1 hypothetical protein JN550_010981 [Neoarthrinium moseri]